MKKIGLKSILVLCLAALVMLSALPAYAASGDAPEANGEADAGRKITVNVTTAEVSQVTFMVLKDEDTPGTGQSITEKFNLAEGTDGLRRALRYIDQVETEAGVEYTLEFSMPKSFPNGQYTVLVGNAYDKADGEDGEKEVKTATFEYTGGISAAGSTVGINTKGATYIPVDLIIGEGASKIAAIDAAAEVAGETVSLTGVKAVKNASAKGAMVTIPKQAQPITEDVNLDVSITYNRPMPDNTPKPETVKTTVKVERPAKLAGGIAVGSGDDKTLTVTSDSSSVAGKVTFSVKIDGGSFIQLGDIKDIAGNGGTASTTWNTASYPDGNYTVKASVKNPNSAEVEQDFKTEPVSLTRAGGSEVELKVKPTTIQIDDTTLSATSAAAPTVEWNGSAALTAAQNYTTTLSSAVVKFVFESVHFPAAAPDASGEVTGDATTATHSWTPTAANPKYGLYRVTTYAGDVSGVLLPGSVGYVTIIPENATDNTTDIKAEKVEEIVTAMFGGLAQDAGEVNTAPLVINNDGGSLLIKFNEAPIEITGAGGSGTEELNLSSDVYEYAYVLGRYKDNAEPTGDVTADITAGKVYTVEVVDWTTATEHVFANEVKAGDLVRVRVRSIFTGNSASMKINGISDGLFTGSAASY